MNYFFDQYLLKIYNIILLFLILIFISINVLIRFLLLIFDYLDFLVFGAFNASEISFVSILVLALNRQLSIGPSVRVIVYAYRECRFLLSLIIFLSSLQVLCFSCPPPYLLFIWAFLRCPSWFRRGIFS